MCSGATFTSFALMMHDVPVFDHAVPPVRFEPVPVTVLPGQTWTGCPGHVALVDGSPFTF